jgi:Ala-tRNA(Pro) deacylase
MKAQKVYDVLNNLSISFEIIEHEAALTVEEMESVLPEMDAQVCKNLFLRDQKGKQHYLVVMPKEKPFNLKDFEANQGLGKMSFASEKRLLKYLDVPSGSVSPLGLINDESGHVIVYMDASLKTMDQIGVHPNINTATVTFSAKDLEKFLNTLSNDVYWVEL